MFIDCKTIANAVITGDRFLLKFQKISAFIGTEGFWQQRKADYYTAMESELPYCIHSPSRAELVRYLQDAWPQLSYMGCNFFRTHLCKSCASDWSIEIIVEDGIPYIRVTRWTDFGDGLSPYSSPE